MAGAALQLFTVMVPEPDLAELVPQALLALTLMPVAAIEPAVIPVMVIVRVVELPLNPLGNVQV